MSEPLFRTATHRCATGLLLALAGLTAQAAPLVAQPGLSQDSLVQPAVTLVK